MRPGLIPFVRELMMQSPSEIKSIASALTSQSRDISRSDVRSPKPIAQEPFAPSLFARETLRGLALCVLSIICVVCMWIGLSSNKVSTVFSSPQEVLAALKQIAFLKASSIERK